MTGNVVDVAILNGLFIGKSFRNIIYGSDLVNDSAQSYFRKQNQGKSETIMKVCILF